MFVDTIHLVHPLIMTLLERPVTVDQVILFIYISVIQIQDQHFAQFPRNLFAEIITAKVGNAIVSYNRVVGFDTPPRPLHYRYTRADTCDRYEIAIIFSR